MSRVRNRILGFSIKKLRVGGVEIIWKAFWRCVDMEPKAHSPTWKMSFHHPVGIASLLKSWGHTCGPPVPYMFNFVVEAPASKVGRKKKRDKQFQDREDNIVISD